MSDPTLTAAELRRQRDALAAVLLAVPTEAHNAAVIAACEGAGISILDYGHAMEAYVAAHPAVGAPAEPEAPRLAPSTCTHCHHALADHDAGWCYHRDCPCGRNGIGHMSDAEPLRCVNCSRLTGPLAGGLCAGCARDLETPVANRRY